MSEISSIWGVIVLLGIGTFLIRFSFIGLFGNRPFPDWSLRLLRYTGVAILPAIVAPIVAFSNSAATGPDPLRLCAAFITIATGIFTRSIMGAMLAGAAALILGQFIL